MKSLKYVSILIFFVLLLHSLTTFLRKMNLNKIPNQIIKISVYIYIYNFQNF